MAEAAEWIEWILNEVYELMHNDTIMFIFGDHGATEYGIHGGDSMGEMHTNFFAHIKGDKKFWVNQFNRVIW